MPGNWNDNVRHITNNELVDAAVTSRPDRDNEGNIRYLRDRLETIAAGAADIGVNLAVASSVQVGQPVYFNTLTQQFESGLAAHATDPSSGTIVPAASADVLGVCLYKHNATLADIVFSGSVSLDITAAAGANPAPGRYYLSSATAGKLTLQSPAISVPVLFLDSFGRVYVNPTTRNFLTDHVHFAYQLVCAPAGTHTPPAGGQRHTISSPNANLAGWLPANHASFGGAAPAGAAWGYNLAKHPQLQRNWPPIPIEAVSLAWNRGVSDAGATFVPLGPGGLAVLNEAGIWWMSDCNAQVPWPANYNSSSPPSPPGPFTVPPTCPPPQFMSMTLAYSVNTFATKNSVVTRLDSGSPMLTFTDPDGLEASTGALTATLDLDLAVAGSTATGGQVLKTFANNTFTRGWVTEGIKLSGNGLTAAATRIDTTDADNPIYQGLVTIGLAPTTGSSEISPQIVRLDGVADDTYLNMPYYRLPTGRQSTLYLRIDVPSQGLPSNATLALRVLLFGSITGGSLPAIGVTYRRLPRPSSGGQVAIPTVDTSLSFTTGQVPAAYNVREITSGLINVTAGDTVLIAMTRRIGDGYSGDVGFVRVTGLLGGS